MRASKTSADPGGIYAEVERIVAGDMAIIPIYHYANTFLLAADIRGWPYDNVENNWYSKNFYRVAELSGAGASTRTQGLVSARIPAAASEFVPGRRRTRAAALGRMTAVGRG